MAFDCNAGSFVLNTSTGNQAVTGVGFQPKALLFFASGTTVDGITENMHWITGMATGTAAEASATSNDENAQDTSDSIREFLNNRTLEMLNEGLSSIKYRLEFISFDADGFTVNVENAPASAFKVGFIAFGGTDLTNATVGNFAAPTSTGNFSKTGVGFQPDALIFIGSMRVNSGTAGATAKSLLGFALSSTKRGYLSIFSKENVGTTNTSRFQKTDKCLVDVDTTGAISGEADFVSMDADGFTINVTDAWPTADTILFLALKGGQYDFGTFNSQTSIGNFSKTGVGFQPTGLVLASFLNAASASETDGIKYSLGLASGSTERFIAGGTSEDAQDISDTDSFSDDAKVYQDYDFAQTKIGEIDFVSFDSDGFTLNQTDADATGNEVMYLAVGSTTAAITLEQIERHYPRGVNRGITRGVI